MTGNGVVGVKIVPPSFQDIVGVRWKTQIDTVQGMNGRIMFGWSQLWNPKVGKTTHQAIELNWHTYGWLYKDDQYRGWPPKGVAVAGNPYLYVAASEYGQAGAGKIGMKTSSPSIFPRQSAGVDGLSGINKLAAICQRPLLGTPVTIEVLREDNPQTITRSNSNRSDWSWRTVKVAGGRFQQSSELPPGVYYIWNVKLSFDTFDFTLRFALGEEFGQYIYYNEALAFLTEFFTTPGDFIAKNWDHALFRESDMKMNNRRNKWIPQRDFIVHYGEGQGYGFKVTPDGRLECSKDNTETYTGKLNQRLVLTK